MLPLPLEIKTEDGYPLQLSVDRETYICSEILLFAATDLIFDTPDKGWLGDEEGVEFTVTIPAVAPEDLFYFLSTCLPGQIIVFEGCYKKYCWLKDDEFSYQGYGVDIPVEEVRNNLETCVLPDGRKFEVLTWVPGLSPIESLLKD